MYIGALQEGSPTGADFVKFVLIVLAAIVALTVLIKLVRSIRIINQFERGVVYRLGRVLAEPKQPGLRFLIPFLDRMVRVVVAIETEELEEQEVITSDSVSLTVQPVVYYRVTDAVKAEVEVDDYEEAVVQKALLVLRRVIGGSTLEEVLSHGDEVNRKIQQQLEEAAADWGVTIQSIELKDVQLPEGMKRAMAAQAEATREAAAKIVAAQGELDAADRLRQAADLLSPEAMRLRTLQTLKEIGADHNTVIVMDTANGAIAAQAAAGALAAD